jgi:hypothetical protein
MSSLGIPNTPHLNTLAGNLYQALLSPEDTGHPAIPSPAVKDNFRLALMELTLSGDFRLVSYSETLPHKIKPTGYQTCVHYPNASL